MPLFEWSELYSVKINTIDRQHQVLIKWMNSFYNNHLAGHVEIAKNDLKELLRYTKLHFTDEEKMMVKIGYKNFDQHKKMHEHLLAVASHVSQEYLNNPDQKNFESLGNFLKKWLSDHILGADRAYTEPAVEKGIT